MTYCALQTSDSKVRLQCFAGKLERNSGLNGDFSTVSKDLPAGNSPAHLETIASEDAEAVFLLVIFENGDIAVYSEDLSARVLRSRPPDGKQRLKHATTLNLSQAKEGLLKKRGDLLARFEDSTLAFSRLLVLVERPFPDEVDPWILRISVFVFLHQDATRDKGRVPGSELIGSFDIKTPQSMPKRINYLLHHSGQLCIWHKLQMALYQLDGTPTVAKQPIEFPDGIRSLLRLSSNLIAVVDNSSIKIVDIKHLAINSTCSLSGQRLVNGEDGTESKSKLGERLLSYFPRLGSLILLQGRSLTSLNFTDVNGRDDVHHSTTLADAIGRGLDSRIRKNASMRQDVEGFGSGVQGTKIPKDKLTLKIEAFANSGNIEDFDNELERQLASIRGKHNKSKCLSGGASVSPSQLAQHSFLLSFVISKIFGAKPSSESRGLHQHLQIQFMPPQTFRWLATQNLVTSHRIELALKQTGKLSPTAKLYQCAVVEALATYDYSLQTLMFLLAGTTPLTTRETACGTRFALNVLQQSQNLSSLKLLTDTNMAVDQDTEVEERDHHPTPEPEKDADKIHDAQSIMRVCLTRLGVCSDSEVRAALAQEMSTLQLLSLVDYLRTELAGGGWFSHYVDDADPSDDFTQADDQITLMTKVLNSAIDALGTGAWLNSAMADEYAEKIAWMKAETSAALEGIEEATYLKGMLHEALLYVKRAPPLPRPRKMSLVKESGVAISRPVKISREGTEEHALPLGLKPHDRVSKTVIKDGKEIERSKREIGLLKSKMVGAYSIERIMI